MNTVITIMMLVGFYFMLGAEDANKRFNISLRNQTKYLLGLFVVCGFVNLLQIIVILTAGSFPFFPIIFLGVNIYIAKMYADRL